MDSVVDEINKVRGTCGRDGHVVRARGELRAAGPPAEDLLAIELGPYTYYARVSLVAVWRAEGGCGPDEAVGEVPPVFRVP